MVSMKSVKLYKTVREVALTKCAICIYIRVEAENFHNVRKVTKIVLRALSRS